MLLRVGEWGGLRVRVGGVESHISTVRGHMLLYACATYLYGHTGAFCFFARELIY